MNTENTNASPDIPSKKKKRKKKKRFRFFRFLFLTILFLCVTVSAMAVGLVFAVIKSAPPINISNIQDLLNESSFIYDMDGNLVEKVHSADSYRSVVPLEQIPKHLQEAVIAIEDERFIEHSGIDFKRVIGAVVYDIRTRSLAQGASTITMQLAKNFYTSPVRDFTRKIKDAYYAVQIEKQLSKDQILHAYLNSIALGRGTNGVEAASQTYFSKDVSELTLAESAMIAGITKYPSKYSPYLTERIEAGEDVSILEIAVIAIKDSPMPTEEDIQIFDALLNAGKIDRFTYSLLKKGELVARKAVLNAESKNRQEVVLRKMLELGKITQTEYEQAVSEPIVIKLGKKKTQGISSYFIDKLKQDVISAFIDKGYTEDEATGILYNGGLRIYSTLDTKMQKNLENKFDNVNNFKGSFVDENGILQPQGAMVILENSTGAVRAMIGGRGIGGDRIYNRALNPRQPGSSIKPIAVYLPAMMAEKITAATVFNDAPRPDGKGGFWPSNVGRYFGPSTVRTMIEHSSNVVAVKVAETFAGSERAGINEMIKTLQSLGISTLVTRNQNPAENDEVLSLALGGMTNGVTPLDITSAYTVFSNGGRLNSPMFFTKIENSNGDIVVENKPLSKQITDPQTAFIMTDILRTAVERGSGSAAKLPNMPVAGKTGTTNDQKDVWFVGFTPYFTAGTWIGTDMPTPLADGSSMSARLWREVMKDVHNGYPNKPFTMPDGIVRASVCRHTGKLVSNICISAGSGFAEYFKAGTEPKEYCSSHSGYGEPETPSSIDNELFGPQQPQQPSPQQPNSTVQPNPTPNQPSNSTDATSQTPAQPQQPDQTAPTQPPVTEPTNPAPTTPEPAPVVPAPNPTPAPAPVIPEPEPTPESPVIP